MMVGAFDDKGGNCRTIVVILRMSKKDTNQNEHTTNTTAQPSNHKHKHTP